MPVAKVNGTGLYVEDRGEGAPVVLIMGLGANLDWWEPSLRTGLEAEHRVVAFDNRGAARSDPAEEPTSIPLYADDTLALLDALDIPRADVVGFSMGGMIAQELALRHPHRVARLVLGCTFCGGREAVQPASEVQALLAEPLEDPSEAAVRRRFARLLFPDGYAEAHAEVLDARWERVRGFLMPLDALMVQLGAILSWEGTYRRLPEIRQPTLVLHGTEDALVPYANGEVLARNIPGARLASFEGGGHAFGTQEPQRTLELIRGFLAPPLPEA